MANSDPTPLSLPPGLLRSTTDSAAGARYVDGYHVRFDNGRPEKMLGFVQYIADQTIGVVHGAYAWVTSAGNRLVELGDYLKAYTLIDSLDDITPLRASGTLGTDPFAFVLGDATVTVTDTAHGLEAGARVHFDGFIPPDIPITTGALVGNLTSNGSAAINGVTNNTAANSGTRTDTEYYAGRSPSGGKTVYKAVVYGSNNSGYVNAANPNITITLYGKVGIFPSSATDGTLLGTLAPFADTANESGNPRTVLSNDTETVFDYLWVRVQQSGASAAMYCTEVTFYEALAFDGEHTVATLIDADSYTIEMAAVSPITDATAGGAAVTYEYEINPGLSNTAIGLGVGVGPVGVGTVGTPRTSGGILLETRTWFFDRYGNELLVHPSGGTLYLWDEPNQDDRAVAISGAPASARASFVTAEGMIVALGTTTPMTLQWSDRDDPTDWTPSETSTANIRTVRTGNKLVAGTRFPGDGGQAFWSDTAFYGMQFIDSSSFIYETTVLAYDAGLIAPTAFELTRDLIIWVTPSLELMHYSGTVAMAPRWEEISTYFKQRINTEKADKVTLGHTPAKNIVTCHYPSVDSSDGENDEFFEVNLTDWSYTTGPREDAAKLIKRTAHVHVPTAGGAVIATGSDRFIYQHEVGYTANSAAMPWRLRTGRLTIMDGAVDSDINGYIPDCEIQVGDITMTIRVYERPNSQFSIDEQTFTFDSGTEIVDMVAGGRYADFEWGSDVLGCNFRFGKPLLDVAAAGRSR